MDYGESTYTNNVKILLFFFSVVVGPYSFVVVVFSFHHSCGPFVSQIKRLIACIFFMKIKYNIRIYEINTKNQQKYTKQIFKTNRNKKNELQRTKRKQTMFSIIYMQLFIQHNYYREQNNKNKDCKTIATKLNPP